MTTPETFDSYHKWLGIPPAEQPPTLYRLLGVQAFETDADVIEAAADRQSAYLRTLQTGPHAPHAAQLLNYVAAARVCLTDPRQRANYDAVIRGAVPAEAQSPPERAAAGSHAASDDGDLAAGTEFGPFSLLESLRRTPFGHIYKARHKDMGRYVSVKVLPPQAARDGQVVKRFEREQKITLSLNHPNLIAGYAAGVERGQRYLVTEFVVGTDLGTLVQQQGPLPVEQGVDFVLQAARGLTQLHLHGVFHRNIKPQVLYVDMQGHVKVTSLFLARLHEQASVEGGNDELTRMGQVMGTAEYMAPEQAVDAKQVDGRADMYALGCTLHYLLTGRPPYGGKSVMEKLSAHKSKPIPSLAAVVPMLPPHVERVFQRMLAKDPNGRYPFMGDVVADLEQRENAGTLSWLWSALTGWFGGS